MGGDLPDYEKRIIIVTMPGSYPAIVQVDLEQLLGAAFKDPTIVASLPVSIENPAIAYDSGNDWFKTFIENPAIAYNSSTDRFKVDIEAITAGVIGTTTDLTKVLGSALSYSNPVIARLTDGSAFIDPRDMSDRAARLVGIIYGNRAQLVQRAATFELLVQLCSAGVEINPQTIRALTSSDVVTVYGSQTQALLQRASTFDLIVQLRSAGVEIDPRSIRALTNADVVTVEQATAASLKATVTQAAKDRTISSIDAVSTPTQISISGLNGNSSALKTPASGKKLRLKFISLEHSADVDIGYRFGATGTIYYLRTTKGVYVSNLVGANVEGAADAAFYLNSSGSTNVKGYFTTDEI